MSEGDTEATAKKKPNKKWLFLDSFAQNANVLLSARVAGVNRQTVYKWLEHDQEFSFAYNQAKEDAKDTLRAEIYRRGVEGWDEDIYQLGKFAGTVRKYDTTLLIFHAKMMIPEYREKQRLDISGELIIKTEWGAGALDEEEAHHSNT